MATSQQEGGEGIKLYKYAPSRQDSWELVSSIAKPRLYDAKEDSSSRGKKEFCLEIRQGDVDVRVDANLDYISDVKQHRVTFSAKDIVYALKFPSGEQCRAFVDELNDAVFYSQYGMENDETSRAKVMEDYAGVLFTKDRAERVFEPMDACTEETAAAKKVYNPETLEETHAKKTAMNEDTIKAIVMGSGENNYLLRGSKFDVLRNIKGGGVEDKGISFTLAQSPGTDMAALTPSRVLLAQGERRMNLLSPKTPTTLYHADIGAEKIVSTFTFQKDTVDVPIMDIRSDYKAAQMEEHSQFLGLDQNRICRWDLRDKRGVVQQSTPVLDYVAGKDYSRGTNFTCMATSGDGFVAVGSRDGRVRLYNSRVLTQAKTSIPGLGAPITSIDVTYDGKWVLATTDAYLMLIKTTYVDDKGKAANGFESRMGGRGAVPRLLRLKPEDTVKTKGAKFTKGKFTWITEGGHSERWIVAGCGRFSVVWDFSKIRTSATDTIGYGGMPTCTDYFIRSKEEEVVDVQFVHQSYMRDADQPAMVVATPHSLFNWA